MSSYVPSLKKNTLKGREADRGVDTSICWFTLLTPIMTKGLDRAGSKQGARKWIEGSPVGGASAISTAL